VTLVRHAILFEHALERNRGGPAGYLWHLREGLSSTPPDPGIEIVFIGAPEPPRTRRPSSPSSRLRSRLRRLLMRVPGLRGLLINFGPTEEARTFRTLSAHTPDNCFLTPEIEHAIAADPSIVALHCHDTTDALRTHNSLVRLGARRRVKLFLTSHCPELPSSEIASNLRNLGILARRARRLETSLLKMDVAAFTVADVVVAPCPEALECYKLASEEIAQALESTRQRHVPTGIVDPAARPPKIPAAWPFGLRLAYVGRHSAVKGYDLLRDAIPPLLDSMEATMTVAGATAPIAPPSHPRWRELGWIPDPMRLLDTTDLFVLPNRQTYFDIVALEVMAAGVALLASATGGNKYLARMSSGVALFPPDAISLSGALLELASAGHAELLAMGRENRRVFEQSFTSIRFAASYRKIVADELAVLGNRA
jgi:glycosyltransferase involved in cell wall biosynthesis